MKKDITERNWHSLLQLKEHLEAEGKETIEEFTGHMIVTKTKIYTLCPEGLHVVLR